MDIYDEVESTFVRKSFYICPPDKDASLEDWKAWQIQDDKRAAVEKRKYTLTQEPIERPEEMMDVTMRKVAGVWRQTAMVGLIGDAEEGSCRIEPVTGPSPQAKVIIMSQWEPHIRGTKSKGRNARKARARKARAMEAEEKKYSL